jgi:hypothetical protein
MRDGWEHAEDKVFDDLRHSLLLQHLGGALENVALYVFLEGRVAN